MSAKKYNFRDPERKDPEPEAKQEKQYILIYSHPIAKGNELIWPGQVVSQQKRDEMPVFLQIHFWEIGKELEPRIYNKLAANLQKYFKPKKHGG